MLTLRDSEPSAKTSTMKARENITLKSYSSNAEGDWTDYLLSDIFKDMTLTFFKKFHLKNVNIWINYFGFLMF